MTQNIDFINLQRTYEQKELLPLSIRLKILKQLQKAYYNNKQALRDALWTDLHKSHQQTNITEMVGVDHEFEYFIKHTTQLAAPRQENFTLATMNAKVYVQAEPIGPTAIITPFNYPIFLSFPPLIGCIAAGNPACIKYSASTPTVCQVVQKILLEAQIPKQYYFVYEGSNDYLMKQTFALIIFTGSTATGQKIYQNASSKFTRCILELGGCNPCVVEQSANFSVASQQILHGKFTNGGQTCVSPNYLVFIGDNQKFDEFITCLKKYLNVFQDTQYLVKLIDAKKYDQLSDIIKQREIITMISEGKQSGYDSKIIDQNRETRLFPPTLLKTTFEDPVLLSEIFGPVLPIIQISNPDEFFDFFRKNYTLNCKPLSSIIFSSDKTLINRFKQIPSGSMLINECLTFTISSLPFGGIGESGLGSYHNWHSFDQFSHLKPYKEVSGSVFGVLVGKILSQIVSIPYNLKLPQRMIMLALKAFDFDIKTIIIIVMSIVIMIQFLKK